MQITQKYIKMQHIMSYQVSNGCSLPYYQINYITFSTEKTTELNLIDFLYQYF